MALHFTVAEFSERIANTLQLMQQQQLDAMLIFRQESMYYLTGYDSFGYVFFQCLLLKADGRLCLLTRAPDLRQAQLTSIIEDIRIWEDREGSDPGADLKAILQEFALAHRRLGVEYESYGLTGANCKKLEAALVGFCQLTDASYLISQLRVVKSAEEIAYAEKAALLADDALETTLPEIRPQAFEGKILATLQGSIFTAGGEYSGNEFILSSGEHALLCRSHAGRRCLDAHDQLTVEFAATFKHYHAALMRTIVIGKVSAKHTAMHQVAVEAAHRCHEALVPGAPIGKVFDAYAATCDAHGMHAYRFNATGYSLGAVFAPSWMDWPMLYHNNPVCAAAGMIFFIHIILLDSDSKTAMSLGSTFLVTQNGSKNLSRLGNALITV